MNLQQISGGEPLTNAFITEMIGQNPMLAYLLFYRIVGNADKLRKASKASGGKYRDVNSDFPENKVDPEWAQPSLTIMGDKIQVDQSHERRGADVPSVRARKLNAFAREMARFMAAEVCEGDATGGRLAGFTTVTPAAQKIWAKSSSTALTLSPGNSDTKRTTQAEFLEKVMEVMAMVEGGPTALIMSPALAARITTVAAEFVQWQTTDFGKLLPFINGVPVIGAGYKQDGSTILGSASQGSISGGAQSIFAVRFGEGTDLTYATNIGLMVKDLGVVGVHYTHNVELDIATALENDRAIAELRGIKL